ncbi:MULTISPECIES: ROK family protein [unclassified Crossiella]|uniref:ROK family protein n=1 Tax=unclassified Crossiella TaxID=2620835 RepID=UPI001FFE9A9D|nr:MULTISPECIES: ROK family protein [unclassified Crossiella]MCK2244638.1 ROK family protein [Crossiella sp. S99.2]MCK2258375.1 ROK family protein [Crossiella sp. S99.1]
MRKTSNAGTEPEPGRPALLRRINDRAAFELLLSGGPRSRTELVRLTGLAAPTTTQLLDRLATRGLVLPAGIQEGGRGPNAKLFSANAKAAHIAAVDVTHQHIEVSVADLTGQVVSTARTGHSALSRLRAVVDAAAAQAGLRTGDLARVALGCPGALNPDTGRLAFADHLTGWQQPALAGRLAEELAVPVSVHNDVNLVARAEQAVGVARGSESFVWLWLDEGLGMALVLDGRIRSGATGAAGEVSYLPVPGIPLSRTVRTGGHGGYQLIAGAEGVLELAREFGLIGETAWEVTARGNELFLRELAVRIATGLAAVICVLDPELVVLGGRTATAGGDCLLAMLAEELSGVAVSQPRLAFSEVVGNPVLAGALLVAREATLDDLFAPE